MSVAATVRNLVCNGLRKLGARKPRARDARGAFDYASAYEALAQRLPREQAIGGGAESDWYEQGGWIELGVLQMEGLEAGHTLVDFGCGNGRLAVKVIPTLTGGSYIGIDISDTMLRDAERLIRQAVPHPPCSVQWIRQDAPDFRLQPGSVDRMCAFSVFTHMEHEDTFRYLVNARQVIKPQGRLIFSCLPIRLPQAQRVFRQQASLDLHARWRDVRNVVTTTELMEAIARMAGWNPLRWYAADQRCIRLPSTGEFTALGQEVCVLEPAAS